MCNVVKVLNLRSIFYDRSNKIQKYFAQLHNFKDEKVTIEEYENLPYTEQNKRVKNVLLLMEHNHVYTTGLRDCLTEEKLTELAALGAQYRKVNRGGLATYHGPGQLTAYPVLNLRHFKPSAKWYVNRLEETAIQTCNVFGVQAERSSDTGVWVKDNKICAIGVHVSRGITTHGLGFNCCTDLRWYDHITPCGIADKGVTTLSAEMSAYIPVDHVIHGFKHSFENVFDCVLVDMSEKERREILKVVGR